MVATGESHSIQELLDLAFGCVGLDAAEYVVIDPALKRPAEVDSLLGDASRARQTLRWAPRVRFPELVRMRTRPIWRVTARRAATGECALRVYSVGRSAR